MNILEQLAEHARMRVAQDASRVSREEMRERALALPAAQVNPFLQALEKPDMSFICEVKKASPSKGIISEAFPYMEIAGDYERAGADCMSCLTEPKWFLGSDDIFCEIRSRAAIPMLRKDFTIDEYQIYQAKTMGADAVLLICALLDPVTLAQYLELCRSLGMVALVETHSEEEIRSAVACGARIIGVNNRNLKDFSVDLANAVRLRELVPTDRIYVAESGVTGPKDVSLMRKAGADAALIGEALMRSSDRGTFLKAMKEAARYAPGIG